MRPCVDVAVVVPTYNSAQVIARVLQAITSDGRVLPRQVVVADGGSRDDTVRIAEQYPVEVYRNPGTSAAAGRNVGLRHATQDIVAFTDSDCVPDAHWVERIYSRFAADATLVGVGGRMKALEPVNDIEAFCGRVFIGEIMRFSPRAYRPTSKGLPGSFITANCAYRKDVLADVGNFDESFSNHGEDIDLFWRLLKRFPGRLLYDPDIVVSHSFPDSYAGLAKKFCQYGIASSKLAKHHLRTPRVDWSLYGKLFDSVVGICNPLADNRRLHLLYSIQLLSHLYGKLYGSCLVRTLNL